MKTVKPIREGLCQTAMSLVQMATMSDNMAKEAALAFLKGDIPAEKEAWKNIASAAAYRLAAEKIDDLRREVEAGNIG